MTSELENQYLDAKQLEQLTGTRASTWRYWASVGEGPPSFKIGKRRVWKRALFMKWPAQQEKSA
jgi:prophage regulatory protein